MKALVLISIIFTFLSCSKDKDDNKSDKLFTNLDASIGFRIIDNNKEKLLNRNIPNGYTENDIAVGSIDAKGNFIKDTRTDLFRIGKGSTVDGDINELILSLPYPQLAADQNKTYTVYFKIGDNPVDTLKVNYLVVMPDKQNEQLGGSFIGKNNVWLNGKLIWTRDMEEKAVKTNDYTELINNITLIKNPKK